VQEKETGVLEGHTSRVEWLFFSPSGLALVSRGKEETVVRIWDPKQKYAPVAVPVMSDETQITAEASRDGNTLAVFERGEDIRIWDRSKGNLRTTLRGTAQRPLMTFLFSPDGSLLALSFGNLIELWDTSTGERRSVLSGHSGAVVTLHFHERKPLLASGSMDRTVRVWDYLSHRQAHALAGHDDMVTGVRFSPCGRFLASSAADGTVTLWDVSTAAEWIEYSGHRAWVFGLDFSEDGALLATGGRDRAIRVWDLETAEVKGLIEGHDAGVTSLAISPDGENIVAGDMDGAVRMWDLGTPATPAWFFKDHSAGVVDLCSSPDGRLVASASYDGKIRIVKTTTGQITAVLRTETGNPESCSISPDGDRLAIASSGGSIVEFDLRSRSVLHEHPLSSQGGGIAYLSDGRRVVVGCHPTILVWDPPSGQVEELCQLDSRAFYLDAHPSKPLVALPLADGTIRILNIETQETKTLEGSTEKVTRARFSPDGRFLAGTGVSGATRVWLVSSWNPYWHTTALLRKPLSAFSQRGWEPLDGESTASGKLPTRWMKRIENQTHTASQSGDGGVLCVQTYDNHLELWNLALDRQITTVELAATNPPLALADGCVAVERGGRTILVRTNGKVLELRNDGEALSVADGEILIAGAGRLTAHDANGTITWEKQLPTDVCTLTKIKSLLVLGHDNGALTASPLDESPHRHTELKDVPRVQTSCLIPGPTGTVIAGFVDGGIGMWSLESGLRFLSKRLHGPIKFLFVEQGQLHAASELGDVLSVPLKLVDEEYCELMIDVWSKIPIVWEDGYVVAQPPPTNHPCSIKKEASELTQSSARRPVANGLPSWRAGLWRGPGCK
jgi:WD40 repeat protein